MGRFKSLVGVSYSGSTYAWGAYSPSSILGTPTKFWNTDKKQNRALWCQSARQVSAGGRGGSLPPEEENGCGGTPLRPEIAHLVPYPAFGVGISGLICLVPADFK